MALVTNVRALEFPEPEHKYAEVKRSHQTFEKAGEPSAVTLARRIIARENVLLSNLVAIEKDWNAKRASLSSNEMKECSHAIAKKESTVAAHRLILKHAEPELLVRTAQAILHKDLEQHYRCQQEMFEKGLSEDQMSDKEYSERLTQNGYTEEGRQFMERTRKENLKREKERVQWLSSNLNVLKEWQNKMNRQRP
jgi:hypothetical protein